ncbi:HEPN domain-containing protein [Methylocystis sp. JR02]|nr:HEPN domain-containing protein [Methylocystis sp. JR02]MDJ0447215.1 HEPN domain-containing protein [Methylocystis sp. JR02]
MRLEELEALAEERLREALALLGVQRWSGAFYLSGYAIELALKAVIADQFRANEIPDKNLVKNIYTHDLEDLLSLAQLKPALQERSRRSSQFVANWNTVMGWNESARYRRIEETEARALLEAISDPTEGIFAWIRSQP